MKLKRVIGFLVVMLLIVLTVPSVASAAEQQYTENLIPDMTSDTSPSGTASASSTYGNESYLAYHAFDHSTYIANAWITKYGTKTGWLEYDFENAKCITKYTITSRNVSYFLGEMPSYWTFEAWDDQLQEWVVLDTENNITDWELLVKKEFTFNNTNDYYKYRINITANNGQSYTGMSELEMMETVSSLASPANLKAEVINKEVDLTWDAVSGSAISYNVYRSETAGSNYTLIGSTSETSYQDADTTLSYGMTYYYVITTVDSEDESDYSSETTATPKVQQISLKLVLEIKEEKQLSVSEELSDNADMTWTSSDTSVATVDANGIVTALKPGDTVITVVNEEGTYTDTINVLVVDLELQLAVDLYIGETCRLTVDDLTDTVNVTWTSYDSTIATISNKGKVMAVSEGLTYITATDDQGNEIGTIYIRVRQ